MSKIKFLIHSPSNSVYFHPSRTLSPSPLPPRRYQSQSKVIELQADEVTTLNFTLVRSDPRAEPSGFQLAERLLHGQQHNRQPGELYAFSSLLLFVFTLLLLSIMLGFFACIYRTLVPSKAARSGFQLLRRYDDEDDDDLLLRKPKRRRSVTGDDRPADDDDDEDDDGDERELFNLQALQRQRTQNA